MARRHATASAPAAPGPAQARAPRSRAQLPQLGEERYLWTLVALELAAVAFLRHWSRGHHGG